MRPKGAPCLLLLVENLPHFSGNKLKSCGIVTFSLATFFSRFDDMYDLSLVFTDGKTKRSRDASFSKSCADFFDENGLLCQDLVEKAVLALHKSLADKQD